MKKICVVFGTRPEAIKMAPVILKFRELVQAGERIDVRVCVTAQHRQMLDSVLRLFEIVPDYDLDLMQSGQDLTDLTSRLLPALRGVLRELRPDLVLVHGDTTTTFSAALAAYYEQIAVGHVEAGLRTDNIYSPWPEEINRRFADTVSALHFAPTQACRRNLVREGISESGIHVTGNTVIDALHIAVNRLQSDSEMRQRLDAQFDYLNRGKRLVLVTGHRRENFGDGFENICRALSELSRRADIEVVYPVHLNPNVREPVGRILSNVRSMHLIEPLDYLPFVYLMSRAHLILTDSGGIQEEAPSLGKPVLVMRDTSERPEGIDAGTVKLVGTRCDFIVAEVNKLLDDQTLYERMSSAHNPYGDGNAARRTIDACRAYLQHSTRTGEGRSGPSEDVRCA